MGVAWGRAGLLVLVLAVAVPTATVFAQKGGEEGPVAERATSCWPCHVTWSPPLKTFYNILPPVEAGAAVGEPFDVVIQLQGAWTPPKARPMEIVYYEPALDLRNASSLGFYSDTPPLKEEVQRSVSPDPAAPTTPASDFVTLPLPEGATRLSVTLVPDTPSAQTGPDFTLNVYAGATEPTGTPSFTQNLGGRGATETLELLGSEAFLGHGYGNWTFEAVYTPVPADNPTGLAGAPGVTPQGYTLIVDAAVEDTGQRVQAQPIRSTVGEGGSALMRFRLRANAEPAPGETVRLVVNATTHYQHDPGSSPDDYANVTKEYAAEIPVTTDGPRVVLRTNPETATVVAGGGVQNGATMDTVSEAVGYGTAFLLVSSIWTGGMFGKASRRQLNGVFGTAKRRVAFHNFLSYGLILFAAVHTVLFIIELAYHWTIGLLWGSPALLAMLLLGVTGAFQVQMIRRWNYGFWRWSHYGLAVAAIVFTLVHMGLDGVHFGFVKDYLGWEDPLVPKELR